MRASIPDTYFDLTDAEWNELRDRLKGGRNPHDEFHGLSALSGDDLQSAIQALQPEYRGDRTGIAAFQILQTKCLRMDNFVNCWQLSDDESPAMWGIYVDGSDGLAIRSTVRRLIDCLSTSSVKIHIGTVDYVDFKKDPLVTTHMFDFALRNARFLITKRNSEP